MSTAPSPDCEALHCTTTACFKWQCSRIGAMLAAFFNSLNNFSWASCHSNIMSFVNLLSSFRSQKVFSFYMNVHPLCWMGALLSLIIQNNGRVVCIIHLEVFQCCIIYMHWHHITIRTTISFNLCVTLESHSQNCSFSAFNHTLETVLTVCTSESPWHYSYPSDCWFHAFLNKSVYS